MALDNAEQEQVEALKRFWNENGKSIVVGVVVGLAVLFSFNAWQQNTKVKGENASSEYLQLLDFMALEKWDDAEQASVRVVGQYGDTIYAHLASLTMAKVKFDQGDAVAAKAHLRWLLSKTDVKELKDIANIRLAKINISEGQPDQALSLVKGISQGVFSSLASEVAGDAHASLKQNGEAKINYQDAINNEDETATPRLSMLKLKLENVQ